MKRLLSILAIATVVVACNNETNIPVNGMGNNMNMVDARRFCEKIKPQS